MNRDRSRFSEILEKVDSLIAKKKYSQLFINITHQEKLMLINFKMLINSRQQIHPNSLKRVMDMLGEDFVNRHRVLFDEIKLMNSKEDSDSHLYDNFQFPIATKPKG